MGNHKKYRIKSPYDNIMAVKIVLLIARHRTLSRTKAMLHVLLMRTTRETCSLIRQPTLRLFLISFVSLNLTVLRHRLMRRMTGLRNFRVSLTWLHFVNHRLHRMRLSLRDSRMRLMRFTTDLTIVLFQLLLFMAELLYSHATTMVVAVDVVTSRRCYYGL